MSALKARFSDWWHGRTERERWLLAGLALVMTAFVGWYGVMAPLERLSDGAAARQARSAAALAEARTLRAAIGATPPAKTPPAEVIRHSAAQAGLVIDREQPEANGGLSVWVADASARSLFPWLGALQRDHDVGVRSFEAHRAEDGSVEARIGFAGRGE